MGRSKLVKKAQAASSNELSSVGDIPETLLMKETVFRLRVLHASELSNNEREAVWDLYEGNMRQLTEPSSFGWKPAKKKKELFHLQSRFILVHRSRASLEEAGLELQSEPDLVAYSMFRFDRDEGEDLLYCYELQVSPDFRNYGLGRFLVDKLTRIGNHWNMEKVMLTVLKANTSARQFYAKIGLQTDPSSPLEDEMRQLGDETQVPEKYDYIILSKTL